MRELQIKEFAKVKGGKRLPKGHSYAEDKTAFPYLRVTDFGTYTIENIEKLKYLKKETQDAIERYTISKDDLYISIAGTIGRVGYIPNVLDGANLTENAAKITEIEGFELKYLVFYLASMLAQTQIALNTKATSQPKLALYRIEGIRVPLAPLPEQRAIVAKIEQLFSELDNGIANLKAAKDKLEIYRQAVLKKAFEGELSNSTESIEIVPFGDEIKIVSGSTPKGINDVESSGSIPFYKVSDMNHEGNEVEMRTSNLFIDEAIIKELKIKIYPKGTVIFPKRGGAILTNKKRILGQDSAFDLNLMGVLPSEDYLSKYLYYFFVHQDLGKICDGSAVPQINNKNIAPLDFPKCNIEHQRKIISEIESRLSVCDNILVNIEEGLEKSEALRQSILKQAFEGKLLSAEELEACRKEPDWEPAEQLLARIERSRNERIKNKKPAKA